MRTLPPTLVLDCTVTVPWYLTDEASPLSEALFHALGQCTLIVPVLWRLEFVSAMRAADRRGRIPTGRLPDIYAQAARLPIQQDPLALDVAAVARGCEQYELTPYDFVYLAVAQARGLPLATFDGALVRACRRAGVSVVTDEARIEEPGDPYRVRPRARARPSLKRARSAVRPT